MFGKHEMSLGCADAIAAQLAANIYRTKAAFLARQRQRVAKQSA